MLRQNDAVLQSLVVSLVLTKLDYGCTTLAGLPDTDTQLRRLQAVQHAAARLIFHARKFDHVTPLLQQLHWLPIQQRIEFRLATLVFRCLHGTAPRYLADQLRRVADVESRRRLRSSATPELVVPSTRHKTIGDRAFSVTAARAWNNLLQSDVLSSASLPVFRQRLKTKLFTDSYGTNKRNAKSDTQRP